MREIEIIAKSTDKVTQKVTETKGKCKVYDNVAEAVKDVGEARALGMINMRVKIDALNALRTGTGGAFSTRFKNASPEAQAKIKKLLGIED